MKFLDKINRNYLILFTAILLISSVAGYFILNYIILESTKESLVEKEILLIKQIRETGRMPDLYPVIEVKKLNRLSGKKNEFRKILIQNNEDDEFEPFLEYSSQVEIDGSWYSIKLRQSTFENEDLVIILALSLFIIISISFGISFFISKRMNKTIWADFESNLQIIEQFSFSENRNVALLKSGIEEFDRLNRVIENMTGKLTTDYLSLKEFTENASHEIQTPLSVSLLNLDEVLQQDLNEEAFKKTVTSINSLKRLSSLNQSLILLTKIENKQFKADKEISLKDLVNQKMLDFTALFESKNLEVSLEVKQDFMFKMNEQLADQLLNNLFSNAINHNLDNGSIQLKISLNEFKISNTGDPNSLTNETVFNRFVKGNSQSYGLGLAIVKKICDTHQMEILYSKGQLHCFTITKKK